MSGRTGIRGEQVEDESLTGDDVQNESLLKEDLVPAVQTEISENTTHRGLTNNPHSTTKAQVGLGNVDNTSDADKPVSTAQQQALDLKTDKSTLSNKGDLYVRNQVGVVSIPVGQDNFALIADAANALGLAWKQIRPEWIFFDPTDLQNLDPTDDDVKKVLDRLGDSTYTDFFKRTWFKDPTESSTTSTGFVLKTQITTAPVPAGVYEFEPYADIGNSKAGRRAGVEFAWREDGVTAFATTKQLFVGNAVDGSFDHVRDTEEITMTTDGGTFTIQIFFGGRIGGNNNILIKNSGYKLKKVRDL